MKTQTPKKQLHVRTQVRAGIDRCDLCRWSCLFVKSGQRRERCQDRCGQKLCKGTV